MRLSAENLGWSAKGKWSVKDKPIVADVSIDVYPGESFGLIGPNGSGKSTLLRLLAGLLPRAQGCVRLDGKAIADFSRREIAQRIAFVEQISETSETLRVRDVVELGRTPWLSALAPFSARDRSIVNQALEAVDMRHMVNQDWATLSGGERQRVHIARALAQRPQLLILDEPTNHLDIHHQLALLRLVSSLPVTVVMALHDLNQAMQCDRLAVMDQGQLVACGSPAEVLTPERISSIFRVGARPLHDCADDSMIFRFHHLEEQSL